jgi:hypothetical protein
LGLAAFACCAAFAKRRVFDALFLQAPFLVQDDGILINLFWKISKRKTIPTNPKKMIARYHNTQGHEIQ